MRYDPWHYVVVLERKPGALCNGAPFREWELPPPLSAMRQALSTHKDADRQFVAILGAIGVHGLELVTAACAEALSMNAASSDVVLNILGRFHDQPDDPDATSLTEAPERLPVLSCLPLADCGRYDTLLTTAATVTVASSASQEGGRNAAR